MLASIITYSYCITLQIARRRIHDFWNFIYGIYHFFNYFLEETFQKVREKTEENKAKAAELDPTGEKFDKKHKIAAYIGIGFVALIPIIMIIIGLSL